jgi:hypothetical protein
MILIWFFIGAIVGSGLAISYLYENDDIDKWF